MQHIPLWVLKWQGLQNRVVFVTVITDLNTCHPTWYVEAIHKKKPGYLLLQKQLFLFKPLN